MMNGQRGTIMLDGRLRGNGPIRLLQASASFARKRRISDSYFAYQPLRETRDALACRGHVRQEIARRFAFSFHSGTLTPITISHRHSDSSPTNDGTRMPGNNFAASAGARKSA